MQDALDRAAALYNRRSLRCANIATGQTFQTRGLKLGLKARSGTTRKLEGSARLVHALRTRRRPLGAKPCQASCSFSFLSCFFFCSFLRNGARVLAPDTGVIMPNVMVIIMAAGPPYISSNRFAIGLVRPTEFPFACGGQVRWPFKITRGSAAAGRSFSIVGGDVCGETSGLGRRPVPSRSRGRTGFGRGSPSQRPETPADQG